MTGATHETFSKDEKLAPGSERAFGVTMAVVIAVIAVFNLWYAGKWWPWLLGLAVLLAAAAYLRPSLLHPLNYFWFRLGLLMHAVVSPAVLALLFFTAVTPTALIMRLLGKNLLRRKRVENLPSYWIARRPSEPTPGSMKHQF